MYIAHISGLSYDIYAIGETKEELKANMIEAFKKYAAGHHTTVEEFIEIVCNESLENYDNNLWDFLREYLGVHVYNITKGYALGWE